MNRKKRAFIGALVGCVAVFALVVWAGKDPTESTQQLAQPGYSNRCQTQVGLCYVPTAPIGTPCFCQNTGYWGTIVP
jgi:hypothetical protein